MQKALSHCVCLVSQILKLERNSGLAIWKIPSLWWALFGLSSCLSFSSDLFGVANLELQRYLTYDFMVCFLQNLKAIKIYIFHNQIKRTVTTWLNAQCTMQPLQACCLGKPCQPCFKLEQTAFWEMAGGWHKYPKTSSSISSRLQAIQSHFD